jgi:hypothetical protein
MRSLSKRKLPTKRGLIIYRVSSNSRVAAYMEYGVGVRSVLGKGFGPHPAAVGGGALGGRGLKTRKKGVTPVLRSGANTRSGDPPGTIRPRPHLRPAIQQALPHIRNEVIATMRSNIKGQSITRRPLAALFRSGIIKFSSTLGNLSALGIPIPSGMQRLRGALLKTGTRIGDVQALAEGRIGGRIVNKVAGKQTNRMMGQFLPTGSNRIERRIFSQIRSRSTSRVIGIMGI